MSIVVHRLFHIVTGIHAKTKSLSQVSLGWFLAWKFLLNFLFSTKLSFYIFRHGIAWSEERELTEKTDLNKEKKGRKRSASEKKKSQELSLLSWLAIRNCRPPPHFQLAKKKFFCWGCSLFAFKEGNSEKGTCATRVSNGNNCKCRGLVGQPNGHRTPHCCIRHRGKKMTDEIGPRERNEIRPPSNRVTLLMSQICIYTGYVCLCVYNCAGRAERRGTANTTTAERHSRQASLIPLMSFELLLLLLLRLHVVVVDDTRWRSRRETIELRETRQEPMYAAALILYGINLLRLHFNSGGGTT